MGKIISYLIGVLLTLFFSGMYNISELIMLFLAEILIPFFYADIYQLSSRQNEGEDDGAGFRNYKRGRHKGGIGAGQSY